MADKLLSMLGMARRAGKLQAGFDLVVETVKAGKADLVLAAADISEKTFKNLKYEAEKQQVKSVRIHAPMEELGKACGIKAGVIVITDGGFAKAIVKLTEADDFQKEGYTI